MFMVDTISRWTALEEPEVKRQIQTFCMLLSWFLPGTLMNNGPAMSSPTLVNAKTSHNQKLGKSPGGGLSKDAPVIFLHTRQ